VATPLDSLKVRFEVTDLLEGKHRSMYQYAKSTLKELGLFSAYRGFTLTLARVRHDFHYNRKMSGCLPKVRTNSPPTQDSLACGLFFATFEWVKQQGYYNFLDEVYGYQIDSSEALTKVDSSWNHSGFLKHDDERRDHASIQAAALSLAEDTVKEKPPLLLEPIFVITAGAAAAVVRVINIIERPHGKNETTNTQRVGIQAYQAIDHPLSKIHNVFYVTEAQSEFANPRCRESTRKLYRETWERCKMQVRLTGGSWRKYLYQDFTGVLVKVAPATSLGFLVFELAKREIDFRSQ
jgi:hypothetical protein